MTRDFLKSLGIGDKSVLDKIMDENGRDVEAEKAKFGDYDSLKSQLSEANRQIEEFGRLDYDGLKKSADDYKAKLEQAQADSKRQLEEMRFDHALEGALTGAKARNVKAVRALLETERLKLNTDGSLSGLSEQLDALKKNDPYLFEDERADAPAFLGGAGAGAGAGNSGVSDDNKIRAVMGLPPISK